MSFIKKNNVISAKNTIDIIEMEMKGVSWMYE